MDDDDDGYFTYSAVPPLHRTEWLPAMCAHIVRLSSSGAPLHCTTNEQTKRRSRVEGQRTRSLVSVQTRQTSALLWSVVVEPPLNRLLPEQRVVLHQ